MIDIIHAAKGPGKGLPNICFTETAIFIDLPVLRWLRHSGRLAGGDQLLLESLSESSEIAQGRMKVDLRLFMWKMI